MFLKAILCTSSYMNGTGGLVCSDKSNDFRFKWKNHSISQESLYLPSWGGDLSKYLCSPPKGIYRGLIGCLDKSPRVAGGGPLGEATDWHNKKLDFNQPEDYAMVTVPGIKLIKWISFNLLYICLVHLKIMTAALPSHSSISCCFKLIWSIF